MQFLAGRCGSTGKSPEESNSNELGFRKPDLDVKIGETEFV